MKSDAEIFIINEVERIRQKIKRSPAWRSMGLTIAQSKWGRDLDYQLSDEEGETPKGI